MSRFLAALALAFVPALSLSAADWPQFLGLNRDNSTTEPVAPWEGTLKPVWTKPVGEAHSSPVVAGGVVYAFYQPKGKNADALAAFDAKTGDLKWEKSYDRPEFKPLFGNGPRGTPSVSGDKVFTYGGTGILASWDAKTGETDWKVDALKEFGAKNLFFGTSASPLVAGDKVIALVGGKGAGIVALDAKTGKTAWKATDDPSSYASPTVINEQIVALTGSHVRGVGLDGKPLWEVPFRDKLNESSTTPLSAGGLIFASSVTAGSITVKVTDNKAEKAWENKALTCYFSTPVVVGDYLYMVNGMASLTNASITLRCVELKTGKVAWEKKNVGKYHAAILRCGPAGKETLLMLDDNGFLSLFEANPKEFKELARSNVCGTTWAHPALVDGKLYLRDEKELFCFDLNGKK
ncbi:Pyrrolo-quinoline quinone OS=Pedosphaera parvula (strain Ellin514) GN=Cflav_PD4382 PE=4 SV=1: PQQ_2 [Gemmata massiliana]|uniref:Pyrrolo-quinoline quinone repeat domain-containing protein n=1 Tax=Gemmata massiliana TaxID=1210884 RepID=A0A6P2DJH0_9BACT|nr:PQQ-binding-like beta-propeller repeat protein [Gemmata massiliana]VTS02364.1 Pyrrolo-quinoline quinone OS=Pedosphaera parvula (strain Ellin514) GN=Cflav_PD4382 PE=4 SV=1: PQQ_2 [Gemmata massiliana]